MTTADRIASLHARNLLEPLERIALANHVTVAEVLSRERLKPIAKARREYCAYLRAELGWSYPAIGKLLGLDHSTVINAVRKATGEAVPMAEVAA